jgi:protein tyrosine/serine phosphatase
MHEQGNFHAVAEERVYRSRQLNGGEMAAYLTQYRIRSVLNLRGPNKGSGWYEDELRAAEELGAVHYDYAMSANYEVDEQDITNILTVIREAPKPILIHCKSGADRTSLIAALYLYSIEGKPPDEASSQLSILYGHFPYFWNSTAAMDRTFWRYVKAHVS